MPIRLHFGFKLATGAKERLRTLLVSHGKTILGEGWDYLILDTGLTPVQRNAVLVALLATLLSEEPG